MICHDVFAVKNGDCYEFMTRIRSHANNRAAVSRHGNDLLGLMAPVKLVHPSDKAVEIYVLLNGKLDNGHSLLCQ